jgi:glycosyltransferase involved in cell wall biosynthesis
MIQPLFSVLIPAHNHADYLAEAIQSVLAQTYTNFEMIIVDDASSDNTADVISQFNDPRIKYIVHGKNRGLSAARNTGIRASSGKFIAFLDADDFFHPEKIQSHLDFIEQHPEIAVTYNARFELNHSSRTIRELWWPPHRVTLLDLVLGYPFAPSDIVVKKEWLIRVGLYDESIVFFGEDLSMNCRLALAGCQFSCVGKALNYRRYHSGRNIKGVASGLEAIIKVLTKTFSDPRCPPSVFADRNIAYKNTYLGWAYLSFAQAETILGQEYIQEAINLDPAIIHGNPCELMNSFLDNAIADENLDHGDILQKIIAQFPPNLAWLSEQYEWAVSRGYLLKATRAIMWGREKDGHDHFARAMVLGAQIDTLFLRQLTAQLLSYMAEFGLEAVEEYFRKISPYFESLGSRESIRWLKGCYSVNRAFRHYHAGQYSKVPNAVMSAIKNNPRYLANRGALASLIRSIIRAPGEKFEHKLKEGNLTGIQEKAG